MDRINHASAETDKHGGGKDGWTNGDPGDPGSGTVPQEEWFDGVQEEIVTLIEAAGITPDELDFGQLAEALITKIAGIYTADSALDFVGLTDTTPRLIDSNQPDNERYAVWKLGTDPVVRVYYTSLGHIEFAYNCVWLTGTGWVTAGSNEGLISFDPRTAAGTPGITFESTLVANGFTKHFNIFGDPDFVPPTGVSNTLYPMATTKAMGRMETNGSGGGSFFGSFGCSEAVNTNYVEFTMDETMADNRYVVQCTGCDPANKLVLAVEAVNVDWFRVYTYDTSGATLDPATDSLQFFVEVKGSHA
jgi:hypothetical protein